MSVFDIPEAVSDLEHAIVKMGAVADVLRSLGAVDQSVADYLGDRLKEHQEDAYDAFRRLFKLDQYREEANETGAAE